MSVTVDFSRGAVGLRNTGSGGPACGARQQARGKPPRRLRPRSSVSAPTAIGDPTHVRVFVGSGWSKAWGGSPPHFHSVLPRKTTLSTIRGFPAAARPLTSRSPLGAPPLPGRASLGGGSARCWRERAAMAGPSDPGVPAARWKRHIVRQLRQRDRTQKALFLELVPACECSASRGRRGDRAPARGSICLAPPSVTQVPRRLFASEAWGLLDSLSLTRYLRLASVPALSRPGSAQSPLRDGAPS